LGHAAPRLMVRMAAGRAGRPYGGGLATVSMPGKVSASWWQACCDSAVDLEVADRIFDAGSLAVWLLVASDLLLAAGHLEQQTLWHGILTMEIEALSAASL
jgi:hypothetical protein